VNKVQVAEMPVYGNGSAETFNVQSGVESGPRRYHDEERTLSVGW
jgi:hypothetical protein